MAHFLPPPESLRTSDAALYAYLYQYAESLNMALSEVNTRLLGASTASAMNVSSATTNAPTAPSTPSTGGVPNDMVESYNALKSLIVKTADTVRAEMESMTTTYDARYLAISDFGEFESNLNTTITENAEGLLLNLGYDSRLEAAENKATGADEEIEKLKTDASDFTTFKQRTEQRIKIGKVGEKDDGTPIAGVVIGDNLIETEIDGVVNITSPQMYSCFTADRLSFFKNGSEVAWFSNEVLYVHDIQILNSLKVGNWDISTARGYAIKWIGGGS